MSTICLADGEPGLAFPATTAEHGWPTVARAILYGVGLLYFFLGVAILADIFMGSIEKVTSKLVQRRDDKGRLTTSKYWNDTVATLTLMALGSSAPEICLAVIDCVKKQFHFGELGPSTIVGSAAFNLLVIIAVCVVVIPDGETRVISNRPAFYITALFSLLAYLWMAFILIESSPQVVDVWESIATAIFLPVFVYTSYLVDKGCGNRLFARLGLADAPEEEEELPPVLGDIEPIRKSSEMNFLRQILKTYAEGCQHQVPIYGCSAFEYIQYLHIFMQEFAEGKKYQYVCGRTDIQAAHMCGFTQPEGKCALFINDVYGVNSLGESLRMVLQGFGGKQLLLMIWHPSLLKVIDNFHLHRPPMVWPSLGPTLAKYYVRKESDALFVDFEGGEGDATARQVCAAMTKGTPLIVVNMLPEQERDFVSMDVRMKVKRAGL